jgi:16S rRNA (cytosine967-C5)-methyltransferase
LERLSEEGIRGEPTPYAPTGIILEPFRGRPDSLASFQDGLFQVQDEAAQITSHILAPEPGDTILDLCSGLGGKASHLAELMGGRGTVVSLDINHHRLINLMEAKRRLGLNPIQPIVADASRPLTPLFRVAFDTILVDAPCSGLGVLSRHPDGKWNKTPDHVLRLSEFQESVLLRAASVLREGGSLLYVTCTISRQENEGVVRRFLEKRQEFRLEHIGERLPSWGKDLVDGEGFLKTLPHVHHMDGFFAALLVRT